MCGRFTVHDRLEEMEAFFRLLSGIDLLVEQQHREHWQPLFNIAPTHPVSIIRTLKEEEQGEGPQSDDILSLKLAIVQWGLVPLWAKDPSIGAKMINARSETASQKPSFRGPMRYRRCLIPANGFYEWKSDRVNGKQPYYISSKQERWLLFAGIWDHWTGPDGSEVETAAILTTSANETLKPLHERMPVLIPPSQVTQWLDMELHPREVEHLLQSAPEDQLQMWPVTTRMNSPKYDCAEALDRQPEMPPKPSQQSLF